MDKFVTLKAHILIVIGGIGSIMADLLGGWDVNTKTLVLFMVIDYLAGFLIGALGKSPKSENGGLQSKIGWIGLCKKGMVLAIVLIATRLDMISGSDMIRNAVVIGFIANEAISIIENAGLMGIPIPSVITKAIDVLKEKAGE